MGQMAASKNKMSHPFQPITSPCLPSLHITAHNRTTPMHHPYKYTFFPSRRHDMRYTLDLYTTFSFMNPDRFEEETQPLQQPLRLSI